MKTLQLGGSRCHFLPLVPRAKLGGEGKVSVGRGEVGLPEKEELGPPSSSAHTQGLPCKALGMKPQEALSFGGSSRDPLRKKAGCLGPGEHVCVCVVCVCMRTGTCVHEWL